MSLTRLLVLKDDWGGTYDHVVPPSEGVPDDEAPCNVPKQAGSDISCSGFDFKRIGLRTTAMAISPWVKKASIIQEPTGPYNTSQWEHSTASSTIKHLFNLSTFLTKRDAWAGSLTELLLDEPRTDTPEHFPTSPKVAAPWTTGPGGVPLPPTAEEKTYHAEADDGHHCSVWQNTCDVHEAATTKQKNKIDMYVSLMDLKPENVPVHAEMTKAEANAWLAAQWQAHMASVQPPVAPARFNITTTRSCSADRYQQFSTELHISPTDELIYMGGLPPLANHDHMHNPDYVVTECHKIGGCCLSAGSYDVERKISNVAAAKCNGTDLTQRWSAVGGQLCLMHSNRCLTYLASVDSVVLTPFAGVGTHDEQQWAVTASSVEFRGEGTAEAGRCLEGAH